MRAIQSISEVRQMASKVGPVIDTSVWIGGERIAESIGLTLPEVTPVTADYAAMGTISLPVTGLFESMEMTLTNHGIDDGFAKLIALRSQTLQFRWVHDVLGTDGTASPVGYKANVRGMPKTIPGIEVAKGEAQENEISYEVTRYELLAGGKQIFLIDRLSNVLKVNGVDYYKSVSDLL
jgi:phage tail tube protein FII